MIWNLIDVACMDCPTVFTSRALGTWDTDPCPCCGSTEGSWEPWTLLDQFDHDYRLPGDRFERPHSVLVRPRQ